MTSKKQEKPQAYVEKKDSGKKINKGYTKPQNSTLDSPTNAKFAPRKGKNLMCSYVDKKGKIYAHNFSLKFPLRPDCKIPFSKRFNKFTKLPRGENNVRYTFNHSKGFIRQTNKSLIVYPRLEIGPAIPNNSYKLKALLVEKAFEIVKALADEHIGLKVCAPQWEPLTQEYAIKDSYAESIDFKYENKYGIIDKSVRVDESGHTVTGGEIDYKTPEFADAYIKMPIIFTKAMKTFEVNMASHIKAIKQIGMAAEAQVKATLGLQKSLAPKRRRHFRSSLKKSATVRGVR